MSRYCLDTSGYSHFQRGHPAVVELLDQATWVGMPTIVLGELWTGFLLGGKREQNERALNEFLRQPVVVELPVDREVGRIYAEIVVALRKAGRPVPTNDIWIAASAVRMGATVLTCDPHFSVMEAVPSIVLPVP